MSEIRVWAPNARRVEARIAGVLLPMQDRGDGWHSIDSPELHPGVDYSFVLDGGDPLPDPRSPWQPYGVHGASRLVDPAFPWTDRGWQAPPLSSAIIYELHIGAFTPEGTFDGAIAKLDHLDRLGITHVELMPVQEFSGDWGWGYDGVDLFAPHRSYGGPDGLKRFIDAAHDRGLAVLLDVVHNHLGPVGNYLARFGPYFTGTYSTPWGPAVNLDSGGSTEVRRFLCDNALMWLRDYHFDGLRLDAIHAIHDSSAIHFLQQLSEEVAELAAHLGRNLALIAESDLNDPRVVLPRESGGYGLDAQWSDDFHHALHAVLTEERSGYYADFGSLADLAKALTGVFVYDGQFSKFRNRNHGKMPCGLTGRSFLAYLQNHDQTGNRARGERSSTLMNRGRLKIGAALVLLGPFIPMLFHGEEFAAATPFLYFTDHHDPETARAVTEGRRREFASFGWKPEDIPDPQNPGSFLRSKLDWDRIDPSMLEWHRRLIALRRSAPELSDGRLDRVEVRFNERQRWMTVRRGRIVIALNLAAQPSGVPMPFPCLPVLSSYGRSARIESEAELPPDSVLIAAREDFAAPAFFDV